MTARPTVAVVTDALSPDFYFPIWHRYYAAQFGAKALHVLTYPGFAKDFADCELGGIVELSDGYLDEMRAKAISGYAAFLLEFNDVVIRVDADEFVVPDLRRFASLADYLARTKLPYVTALGLDVIQRPDEAPLDLARPILIEQRNYAYANTSLNKTCMTRLPLRWSPGFHACTVPPQFDGCFLIHLKRADVEQQMRWFAFMNPQVTGELFKEYYSPNRAKIEEYHYGINVRPMAGDVDQLFYSEYHQNYLESVKFVATEKIYGGDHFHDQHLVRLPASFAGLL